MLTENESKALQLAKRVFDHFTKDALPFAREILALEHALGLTPVNGFAHNGHAAPIHEIEKSDGLPADVGNLTTFPLTDITSLGPKESNSLAHPVYRQERELVHNPEDDLPF